MLFIVALMLAYGPLNWSFPWWVWVLAFLWTPAEQVVRLKK